MGLTVVKVTVVTELPQLLSYISDAYTRIIAVPRQGISPITQHVSFMSTHNGTVRGRGWDSEYAKIETKNKNEIILCHLEIHDWEILLMLGFFSVFLVTVPCCPGHFIWLCPASIEKQRDPLTEGAGPLRTLPCEPCPGRNDADLSSKMLPGCFSGQWV